MKITRVLLQSKLDELIQLLHTYLLMKITRDSLQSKRDELMSFLHTLERGIRVGLDNDISSSSFDCNDRAYSRYLRRRIRVDNDVSIAMILVLFSSQNTCQHFNQFIQLRLH